MSKYVLGLILSFSVSLLLTPTTHATQSGNHETKRLADSVVNTYKLKLPRTASCPVLSYTMGVNRLAWSTGDIETATEPTPGEAPPNTPALVSPREGEPQTALVAWSVSGPYLISSDEVALYPKTWDDAISFKMDGTPGSYLGDDELEEDSGESDDDSFEIYSSDSDK